MITQAQILQAIVEAHQWLNDESDPPVVDFLSTTTVERLIYAARSYLEIVEEGDGGP